MKYHRIIFLSCLVIFSISCEENLPSPPEIQQKSFKHFEAQDIPDVTNTLLEKIGLRGGQRFSVNGGNTSTDFEIDWDEILQMIDTQGRTSYAFRINTSVPDPNAFYNLVMRYNESGDPYRPFIVKYEMDEIFAEEFARTGSMANFSGNIVQFNISLPNGSNNSNSYNAEPFAPRSVVPDQSCEEEVITVQNGRLTYTRIGGTSSGGGGTLECTTYEFCHYFLVGTAWTTTNTSSDGGAAVVTESYLDWSLELDYCEYTEVCVPISNHTEVVPDGADCDNGDGELPILTPDDDLFAEIWEQTKLCTTAAFDGNPCLASVLDQLKSTNAAFSVLKNFLGENPQVSLCIDATGQLAPGTRAKTSLSGTDITISVNTNLLNRSALSIARTILHELIHAELGRKVASLGGTVSPEDFPGIYDYYRRFALNWEHQQMAAHYIGTIAAGLETFDNSGRLTQLYEDIAWDGLWRVNDHNNPGTVIETAAWQSLPSSEQTRILTEILNFRNTENKTCN